jgi:hypothetical protein
MRNTGGTRRQKEEESEENQDEKEKGGTSIKYEGEEHVEYPSLINDNRDLAGIPASGEIETYNGRHKRSDAADFHPLDAKNDLLEFKDSTEFASDSERFRADEQDKFKSTDLREQGRFLSNNKEIGQKRDFLSEDIARRKDMESRYRHREYPSSDGLGRDEKVHSSDRYRVRRQFHPYRPHREEEYFLGRNPNLPKKKTALDYLFEQSEKEMERIRRDSYAKKQEFSALERQYVPNKPWKDHGEATVSPDKRLSASRARRRVSSEYPSSPCEEDEYPFPSAESIQNMGDMEDILFRIVDIDGKKEYSCPEKNCGKSFPSLSRIKRHYIVHTGVKPYKCLNPRCQKSFSRKDNMLQHYRSHCSLSKGKKRRRE